MHFNFVSKYIPPFKPSFDPFEIIFNPIGN